MTCFSMRAMFLLIDCKDYMEANKQRMVRSTSAEHWAMDESKTASFNKSDQLLINKVLFCHINCVNSVLYFEQFNKCLKIEKVLLIVATSICKC